VFSALIHDVDHRGVPNFLLIKEEAGLNTTYNGKSVAEQNSVDIAWATLMSAEYEELRACIFGDISELRRFRQLLVNSIIATDIFDKELGVLRKSRWQKAFHDESTNDGSRTDINRKATIVIEHLIQAYAALARVPEVERTSLQGNVRSLLVRSFRQGSFDWMVPGRDRFLRPLHHPFGQEAQGLWCFRCLE
jgi:hypothetical protein